MLAVYNMGLPLRQVAAKRRVKGVNVERYLPGTLTKAMKERQHDMGDLNATEDCNLAKLRIHTG
ncbi:hypothetical protein E2C01_070627 [Portunus trituberculatus]|uniref:Uncharacterized protein n=1 Tax=Portunus trituberculatus TaxID=210409 RepID=A0A5B7HUN2_PORTR|nr:hypothetical protein [Portunus trituberculatus]